MKFFYFLQLFIQKLTWTLVVKTMPRQTLIRENTAFPRQKPWQLASAEANFEG